MKFLYLIIFLLTGTLLQAQTDSAYYNFGDSAVIEDYEYTEEEEELPGINPEAVHSASTYKSEKINTKEFSSEEWKDIVGNTNYEEKEQKSAEDLSSLSPWGGALLKVFSYVVIFALVAIIIYMIVKNTSIENLKAKSTAKINDLKVAVDDIETVDLDGWLKEALAAGDLRLAIRVYYISLLSNLNKTGKIIWKKDKTNLDYLTELFSKNYFYNEVRRLTLAYETVWYGEYPLTQTTYEKLVSEFEKVNDQLKPRNA